MKRILWAYVQVSMYSERQDSRGARYCAIRTGESALSFCRTVRTPSVRLMPIRSRAPSITFEATSQIFFLPPSVRPSGSLSLSAFSIHWILLVVPRTGPPDGEENWKRHFLHAK